MAEAISFRRGSTSENNEFIGVVGEIVVDMGDESNQLSTQNNNTAVVNDATKGAPTLRFHLGNSSVGGVLLARADMANVHTRALAEKNPDASDMWHKGENLAYANLSNIEYVEDAGTQVRYILDQYGIAYKDTTNINTQYLTEVSKHSDRERITSTGNKPLAYRDTTNINTKDLTDISIHGGQDGNKPLSYADASNTNTAGLAERKATIEYTGSSISNITIDTTRFTKNMPEVSSGVYTFTFSSASNSWQYNGNNVVISNYGISYADTPANLDQIIVTYGYQGKNLAYADTKNINTADLLDKSVHSGSNKNSNIALLDYKMGNISDSELKSRIDAIYNDNTLAHYEDADRNKETTNINSNVLNTIRYPSNNAIHNYIQNTISDLNYAKNNFNNITQYGWDIAASNTPKFKITIDMNNGGNGYNVNDTINTNIKPNNVDPLIITATETFNNKIIAYKTNYDNYLFDTKLPVLYHVTLKEKSQNLTVTINQDEFVRHDTNFGTGDLRFEYIAVDLDNESETEAVETWTLNGVPFDLAQYGINVTGTPQINNYIIITIASTQYIDSSHNAEFNIYCEPCLNGSLMKTDMSNSKYVTLDNSKSLIGYTIANLGEDYGNIQTPFLESQYTETNMKAVASCSMTGIVRYDLDNVEHNNVTVVSKLSTHDANNRMLHGIYVTEDGAYYSKDGFNNNSFVRDNLISTIGYCDSKQNTQNIEVITSGTTITLKPQTAIYQISPNNNITINIDTSQLSIANNTAKTFEIYVKLEAQHWSTTWTGIDYWLTDSEQSPLNPDKTSVFTVRVQNINGEIKVVANYGGEF